MPFGVAIAKHKISAQGVGAKIHLIENKMVVGFVSSKLKKTVEESLWGYDFTTIIHSCFSTAKSA
jgi:hypothetical protein